MRTCFVRSWTSVSAVLVSVVTVSICGVSIGGVSIGGVSITGYLILSGPARAQSGGGAGTSAPAERVPAASTPAITRAELEAHVRYLAADERRGRMTGSPQAEECAAYLAGVFAREGLEPAGDGGTYLERVPLVRTSASGMPQLRFHLERGEPLDLVFGSDFDFRNPPRAGEGLKLVVAKSAAELPAAADAKIALFVDASSVDRRRWLEEAGLGRGQAFGMLLVPGNAKAGTPHSFESSGAISRASAGDEPVATVRVNGSALERLRSGTVRTIDVEPHAARELVNGSNVVARIAGAGTAEKPELAKQVVVVTAHYDHLDQAHGHEGGAEPGADVIYNGADDDASGVAAVLEIAGAMAKAKPPARTVVFLLVTGEEIGLLGTEEYLDHPVVPLESTVANVNFEMIGRPDPKAGGTGHLWLTGFERTNLGPAFAAAKLAIVADPYPSQNFYQRSDNIAFVQRGVIGQTLSSYNLHTDYHTPADEADKIDFAHMEGCTKAGLAAVQMIASGELTPEWAADSKPKRARH
jgi:hypothetical protein